MSPADLEGISTRAWIDDQGLRPDAEAVVLALLRLGTYCADVDALGADAAVAQMQLAAAAGVRYLDGGWSQLTDALAAGVEVRAATAVRSLEPAAGRFELLGDDGRVVARQVVIAVGPPAAARRLLPDPPDWGDLGRTGDRGLPRPGRAPAAGARLRARHRHPAVRHHPGTAGPPGPGRRGGGGRAALRRPLGRRGPAGARRPPAAGRGRRRRHRGRALPRLDDRRLDGAPAGAGGLRGRPGTGRHRAPRASTWPATGSGPDGLLADAALASGAAAGVRALAALERTGSAP